MASSNPNSLLPLLLLLLFLLLLSPQVFPLHDETPHDLTTTPFNNKYNQNSLNEEEDGIKHIMKELQHDRETNWRSGFSNMEPQPYYMKPSQSWQPTYNADMQDSKYAWTYSLPRIPGRRWQYARLGHYNPSMFQDIEYGRGIRDRNMKYYYSRMIDDWNRRLAAARARSRMRHEDDTAVTTATRTQPSSSAMPTTTMEDTKDKQNTQLKPQTHN